MSDGTRDERPAPPLPPPLIELVPSSAPADDYLGRMVASGELPTLARVLGSLGPIDAEGSFASGLELVLAGLAARIER